MVKSKEEYESILLEFYRCRPEDTFETILRWYVNKQHWYPAQYPTIVVLGEFNTRYECSDHLISVVEIPINDFMNFMNVEIK